MHQTVNLEPGSRPTVVSLLDAVVSRIEQFGTGGQYSPATPNPWRKGRVSPHQSPTRTSSSQKLS